MDKYVLQKTPDFIYIGDPGDGFPSLGINAEVMDMGGFEISEITNTQLIYKLGEFP